MSLNQVGGKHVNFPDANDVTNPDVSNVVNLDNTLKELIFTRKLVYELWKIVPEQVFVDVFAFCVYLTMYANMHSDNKATTT